MQLEKERGGVTPSNNMGARLDVKVEIRLCGVGVGRHLKGGGKPSLAYPNMISTFPLNFVTHVVGLVKAISPGTISGNTICLRKRLRRTMYSP